MMRRQTNRGGFALLMAIIMMTLLGIALAAMSAAFAYQAKRTGNVRRDAQLRQLLLAGADAVAERAQQWPADAAEQKWTVELPKALAGDGASLAVTVQKTASADAAKLIAVVRAAIDGMSENQTLTLTRIDGRWRISQALLGEPGR